MKESEVYNTKQKDLILDAVKKQSTDFTVKDIYNYLNESVGLTTIYRFIDKLVNEDRLSKTIGKDNITYYRYLEKCEHDNHFYLKCANCGCMVHVDCDCIKELSEHIFNKHNFIPLKENIIIMGICEKCVK